ncbi:Rid family hydrolase [Aquamicrobium sp. LC103]|uniref:Rid family hydrolase n=1 Tax=Aquamicrobium sp. LC103 TaxID=1120658 RepID=UPI00063E93AB|nr:Rid family hydrolase [Aquamicrobium sp. LC103]
MDIVKLGRVTRPGGPNIALGAATSELVSVCLTAPDKSGTLAEQTIGILDVIESHFKTVGSSRAKLLMVQVWLAEISQFAEFRDAWNTWIEGHEPPALSVVTGTTARRDCLVEIRAYAAP